MTPSNRLRLPSLTNVVRFYWAYTLRCGLYFAGIDFVLNQFGAYRLEVFTLTSITEALIRFVGIALLAGFVTGAVRWAAVLARYRMRLRYQNRMLLEKPRT